MWLVNLSFLSAALEGNIFFRFCSFVQIKMDFKIVEMAGSFCTFPFTAASGWGKRIFAPCLHACIVHMCTISHVCSASSTVSLPQQQDVVHHCHITTLGLGSFSPALYGTFTPIVRPVINHGHLERHGVIVRDGKLSSPTLCVVTLRVL